MVAVKGVKLARLEYEIRPDPEARVDERCTTRMPTLLAISFVARSAGVGKNAVGFRSGSFWVPSRHAWSRSW